MRIGGGDYQVDAIHAALYCLPRIFHITADVREDLGLEIDAW
jgi:hypothetical protein